MDKIRINLATRRYVGRGTGIYLPGAVLIMGTVVFFCLMGHGRDYAASIASLEKRLEEISPKSGGGENKIEERLSKNRVYLEEISGQRSYSWIGVLDNLEKALPPGVTLNSIEPSFKEGGAKLTGFARDFSSLSRFINNLEGLGIYRRVYLISQSWKKMESDKEAIMFNIAIEGGG